jgi:hypothetical protein
MKFHKANVTINASLDSIFDNIFKSEGRTDYVLAHAGIVKRDDFNAKHPTDGQPPEPKQLSIDISLKAVVTTSYLAQHYSGGHLGRERARSRL